MQPSEQWSGNVPRRAYKQGGHGPAGFSEPAPGRASQRPSVGQALPVLPVQAASLRKSLSPVEEQKLTRQGVPDRAEPLGGCKRDPF